MNFSDYSAHNTFENQPMPEAIFSTTQQQKNGDNQSVVVKTKLQTYVAKNTSAKDRRLLENHVHCFILLS